MLPDFKSNLVLQNLGVFQKERKMPHSEFCENVENEIFVVLKRRNAIFDHSCFYLFKQPFSLMKGCARKIYLLSPATSSGTGHHTKQIQLLCWLIIAVCVKIEVFFLIILTSKLRFVAT